MVNSDKEEILGGKFVEISTKIYRDDCGYFFENWSPHNFEAARKDARFVKDDISRSTKGMLNGLHFQKRYPLGNLVCVTEGEVFTVAVDLRPDSPMFGKWHGATLDAQKRNRFYIPENFAHGFLTLSETAVFSCKCTDFYHTEDEGGILWSDPDLSIDWPDIGMAYVLSEKDRGLPLFGEWWRR